VRLKNSFINPLVFIFFALTALLLTTFIPLQFAGDVLAIVLLLMSGYLLSARIGLWAWLAVATHIFGSLGYFFYISRASYVSDTQSYYSTGKLLSTTLENAWTGLGTGAVNYLSAIAQSTLPVSILGLAWLFSSLILIFTPSLKNSPVNNKIFLAFYFFSPNVILWGGLLSKDMICVGAAILSISAIIKLRQGKVGSWLIFVVISGILSIVVRPYMAPILLFPHAVVLIVDYFMKFRSGGLGNLPVSVLVVIPCLFIGLAIGIQQMYQYVGIEGASGVGDRLNLLNEQLFFGGSAVNLTPPEKLLVLFSPLPFRVRNIFDLLASIASMFYLYTLINLIFKVNTAKVKVDWGLILFSITALLMWSFVFANASNLGALERLKAQVLPFLFLLFAHLRYSIESQVLRSSYTMQTTDKPRFGPVITESTR